MNLPNIAKSEFQKTLQDLSLTSPTIDKAMEQAEVSHKDQLRDNGNSYLTEHIYPVANEVIKAYGALSVGAPEKVIISALLHDSIEDDPAYTYGKCKDQFGKEIADIVQALTKSTSENSSMSQAKKMRLNRIYLERVAEGPSEAIVIKLADRFCNVASVYTIKETHPAKYDRYLLETEELFLPLAKKYSPYFYDKLSNLLHDIKHRR